MLKKNYEFKQVLTKGSYYSGELIRAVILKRKFKINFLGIAINKKFGIAVKRNKVKRLLRENYKILESKLEKGYMIIFLVKNGVDFNNINFWTINKDMINILESARILRD